MCDCGPRGGDYVTDAAAGDVVCRSCGVVVEGHILDERAEYYSEEAGNRAGPAESWLLPSGPGRFDVGKRALGNHDPHESTRAFFRVVDAVSRGFSTDVVDTAKMLCRDLAAVRVVRTDSRPEHAAAALFLATKVRGGGAGRSKKEIAARFVMAEDRLTALARVFVKALATSHPELLDATVRPDDLILRAVDRLDLEDLVRRRVKRRALDLAGNVPSESLEGKTPRAVCGGVVALALQDAGVRLSKQHVATACMVSASTVDKMERLVASLV